jgi:hypothetical protein
MAETFCGKSCESCTYQQELNCPGCADGPGHKYRGDCRLKKCCVDKCHETCATCQLNIHCGIYRDRHKMPQQRIEQQQRLEAQRLEALRRAPIFGRWFTVLFWLQIPGIVANIMVSESVAELLPGLRIPGILLNAAVLAATALVLLLLSKEEDRYRTAGWCILISCGLNLAVSLLPQLSGQGASLLLGIPSAVLSLVGRYNAYRGHSAVLHGVDDLLAEDWISYWKWYIGVIVGTFACVLLAAIAPALALIAVIILGIGAIIVGVWELVLLYNTARVFREFR